MRHDKREAGPDRRPHVVIVGAGFGGLSAAKRLARAPVDVTLIDRRNHHLFQPLLYQVATAALSPADIAAPIRAVLKAGRRPNLTVLLDEATGIDVAGRRVLTRDGAETRYDALVLATGSEFAYFGHDDWARFAPGLKSVEDAVEIRRRVLLAFERAETSGRRMGEAERRRLLTFAVIGGGPTGVEMAGALIELARATLARDFDHIDPAAARVVLVEAGPRLLAGFPERLGAYARGALERMGVEVRADAPVEAIDADGVSAGGERVPAATVIWCAGVAATPVARWLGVEAERGGRVRVEPDMSLPGHPEIFVIGDAAQAAGPDGEPLPGLAPVAKQQGRHVADTIAARAAGRPPPAPFRYRDWGSMATVGRSAAVGLFGRAQVTGLGAWLLWGIVHIAYLIGFRNRAVVAVNWLWAWATYAKGARLITGRDPGRDAGQEPGRDPAPEGADAREGAERARETEMEEESSDATQWA